MRLILAVVAVLVGGTAQAQYPAYQFGGCPGGQCPRPVVQAVQDVRHSVGQVIHTVGNVVQGSACQPVQVAQTGTNCGGVRHVGPVRRAVRRLLGCDE